MDYYYYFYPYYYYYYFYYYYYYYYYAVPVWSDLEEGLVTPMPVAMLPKEAWVPPFLVRFRRRLRWQVAIIL